MSKCKYISKKADRLCTGDLNKKIILKTFKIDPSGSVSYSRTEEVYKSTWARIDTTQGIVIFDSVHIEREISHRFYIRYDAIITALYWVEYNAKNFDILTVENINEENLYLKLNCTERGDKTINANKV